MEAPSYVSDPQIQPLSVLLNDIRIGDITVPRFQRPLVWTNEQRLDQCADLVEELRLRGACGRCLRRARIGRVG